MVGMFNGHHPNGVEHADSLADIVSLSSERIVRVGDLVDKESELMQRFVAEIAPRLRLLPPMREGDSPMGSSDKLDYLCHDASGRAVVVEMKKADGEKHVVEQVLRYIRGLRRDPEYEDSDPRGIIVTGEGDLHTRRALEELERGYHIDWYVYGLDAHGRIQLEHQHVKPGRT
jgi:hypothetical protein